ncbi:ABA4-like family protein [Candidatus Uabimicrobium sp. HlEnr_7]|uniref:ABA4-like family protein n=1 Tax=Candidatus Uabimicrobium helgolandensis TaxID=3095367 RepID=UPI0035582641
MDFLFHFSAYSVLPFWAIMIFFPHYSKTKSIIKVPWIILPATICYIIVLMPNITAAMSIFYGPSPELATKLMSEPWGGSLFWIYAGAFDLFVGRWIYLDAMEKKITSWFISPILFVCIFFGPLGFFLYTIVSLGYSKIRN